MLFIHKSIASSVARGATVIPALRELPIPSPELSHKRQTRSIAPT